MPQWELNKYWSWNMYFLTPLERLATVVRQDLPKAWLSQRHGYLFDHLWGCPVRQLIDWAKNSDSEPLGATLTCKTQRNKMTKPSAERGDKFVFAVFCCYAYSGSPLPSESIGDPLCVSIILGTTCAWEYWASKRSRVTFTKELT